MVGRFELRLRRLLITTSQQLTAMLAGGQSHFLRILVADAIRALLSKGAESAVLGKSPGTRQIIEKFPLSKTGGSKWMSDLVNYVSRIDLARLPAVEYAAVHIRLDHLLTSTDLISYSSYSASIVMATSSLRVLLPSLLVYRRRYHSFCLK